MGIFLNNDDFLPGVITEIESDYSLGYSSNDFGSTESVLLLGTAFSGPVGKPIPVYNPEHGEYVFGKTYDPTTRREATLPAAIKDVYERGCRHIYAVRVSGKQIQKDFSLATDTNLKLRISSLYPTNDCKDCYLVYDNSIANNSKITLYKPARLATITEKNQGLIDNISSQIEFSLDIEQSYGFTKSSKLVDLIRTINEHGRNNVLHLDIVDKYGNDVTHTSAAAQNLIINDLLPGTYFIGRDVKTAKGINTKIEYSINDDVIRKNIVRNNDVCSNYPISIDNVTITKDYDLLKNINNIDSKFAKDSIDYEKVDMTAFELYKILGSGYAITASLENIGTEENPRYKVVQTKDEDPEKIIPLNDGIYSILENMDAKNRVLTCGFADQKIKGILPKLDEFNTIVKSKAETLNNHIEIISQYDKNIKLNIVSKKVDITKENIDIEKIFNIYEKQPLNLEKDDVIITKDVSNFTIKQYDGVSLVEYTDQTEKDYVLGAYNEKVYVFHITDKSTAALEPIGDFEGVINKSDIVAYALPEVEDTIVININVPEAEVLTLAEFISEVNNNTIINSYLDIEVTPLGAENEEAYIGELIEGFSAIELTKAEKKIQATLKIPYTTTDNFARQLAQHCTYTGLKTSPTKGFIGMTKANSVSLESLARKIDEAIDMDFELYAKKPNGHDMFDRNNLPYHIGRNISITFMQYPVYTDDGYTFISNGAAGYAGMISDLPLDHSSTNQQFNIPMTMINLSNYQLQRLTKKGYVTCKDSFTKGLVITDGITMALNDSPYKRLSTIRTIGVVDGLIREAVEPYIGGQNTIATRNSLNTAIKSILNKVKGILIQNYNFEVLYDPRTAKFGNIDIDYEIVPTFEIRKIRDRISIKDTL